MGVVLGKFVYGVWVELFLEEVENVVFGSVVGIFGCGLVVF